MSEPQPTITEQALRFIETVSYADLSSEALRIGRRCVLDTLGLYLAGSQEHSVRILVAEALDQAGRPDAPLPAAGSARVPAALAARVWGTAGHAHDWDDTQVSQDPAHVYGLLTHPSVPPLTAALLVAERLGNRSGRDVMLAFQAGFEVECKISEWMKPVHYRRGHHSSGTVGTFGACVAAAKLLGLKGDRLAHAFGIAASFAAGIRVNFGTMTKPLHVGRACENGVTAALLASRGFEADPTALDGRWGFFSVMGDGFDADKAREGFGSTLSIENPGVSIKPYPSGILTHQSMDAMQKLVFDHDLYADQVERVRFFAGKNIIEPIRYPIARNHLQAKFSMPALLAMIVLRRRASHHEIEDAFVAGTAMQDLQARTEVINDPAIDTQGYDLIRSRIEVDTKDGRTLVQWADERYRGGPLNPINDADLDSKFHVCAEGVIEGALQDELLGLARSLDQGADVARIVQIIAGTGSDAQAARSAAQ